jgi:hypothetical protein
MLVFVLIIFFGLLLLLQFWQLSYGNKEGFKKKQTSKTPDCSATKLELKQEAVESTMKSMQTQMTSLQTAITDMSSNLATVSSQVEAQQKANSDVVSSMSTTPITGT